jgi:hypothetical protein
VREVQIGEWFDIPQPKLYRLTPFSDDAQLAIRGKCSLELAGYDISQLPMATLCNGLSLDWPLAVVHNDVPNR